MVKLNSFKVLSMLRLTSLAQRLAPRLFLSLALAMGFVFAAVSISHSDAQAQARQSFYAEIVKIDRATNKVTLKAVMGHKTLRVAKPDMLEGFKEGDQVIFETGQDGTEVIVTVLTIAKK
jgi:Cu/Ag efflux protein CusF